MSAIRRPGTWLRRVAVAALCLPLPALAQVSYAGSSLSTSSSSPVSSVSVPKPAGLANGQLMLAMVGDRIGSTSSVSSAPSGWTLIQSVAASGNLSLKAYARLVGNAAAEPASYTWTFSSSERASASILVFSGVDLVTPVEASAGQASGASSSYRAPSVTTLSANAMLVGFYAAANGNVTTSAPAGMSLAFDNGGTGAGPNGVAMAASYAVQASAGASGNKDATGSSSVVNAGILVALRRGVSIVNHYELSLPTTSLACLPGTVTVTACADNSSPCTNKSTAVYGATATLAASAGTLASPTIVFDATGSAATTLSHAAAANGAAVTVTLSSESVVATNARQCCPDGVGCAVANSCATTFNTAGFAIAAAANGGAATVPTQTAGTSSGIYYLRAVKTGTATKACESALTGAQSVDWSVTCNDPTSCSAGNRMTLTGSAATAIAGNPNGGGAASTAVPMNFDSNGNAPFSFSYADVGRVTLVASKPAGGSLLSTLTGASNAFVVKPAGFTVSGIRCTTYAAGSCATGAIASPGNNPGAASASGAAFMPAGQPFTATVTAVDASGNATPNYGRETSPEGVVLTPALALPAGGALGTLANAAIAGGSFAGGAATVSNLSFSEVGIVTLAPSVADGNYLGAGDVAGTASGNVGRFVPARFALTTGALTHRTTLGCSPASTFTHLGENFALGFTLTAQNGAGATTANYAGAFAKLDPTVASGWNLAGRDGSTLFTSGNGRLSLGSASGSWVNGVAAVNLSAAALRSTAPDGPFSAAFGIAPVDSDGVALASYDLSVTSPFTSNDRATLGTVALRFGRLYLASASGAADRALSLPASAQYWDGSAFAVNTLDSCTTVAASAVSFGNLRGTLTTADTAIASPITISGGRGTLRLAAPAGGHGGSADVALSLGSVAADASCLQPWTPGAGDAASAGANAPYLRGAWCGGSQDKDPSARVTFGRQRGNDVLLYRREYY